MSPGDDSGEAFPCPQNSHSNTYSIYDRMPEGVLHPGGLQLTKRLVNACAFSRGAKVVDVGCGTGFTVEYLHNECGLCAAGVDISEICLQRGRARTAGLRLTRADGEALPFTSNSVQGVLTECSLSVMGDTGRVLAEINRILVPGGKLAITDLYFRTALSAGYTAQTGGVKTNDELVKMLRERGFSVNIWEDQSAYLKEFVARFIMEHGSAETLWQCLALRQKDKQLSQQMLKRGLGYFLLVAEKQPDR